MPKMALKVKQTVVQFAPDDSSLDLAKFLSNRFRGWAPSHQLSILSGSSSLYFTPKGLGNHVVCDAAAGKSVDTGDIVHHRPLKCSFAVADGLGYDDEDQQFNISLGEVAGKASQDFVEASESVITTPFLEKIARQSTHAALPMASGKESYDSQCSLAAGHLLRKDDAWKAHLVNIGDGMIVIINGANHTVKAIVPAIHKRRFMANYTPDSLQAMLKEPLTDNVAEFNVNEGDYIIAMTDGAYAAFDMVVDAPTQSAQALPDYKKITIKAAELEQLLQKIPNNKYYSALEIGELVLSYGMNKHLQEFQKSQRLHAELANFMKSHPAISPQLTLNKFLDILQRENPELCRTTHQYLDPNAGRDGVTFNLEKNWINDLLDQLQKQEYGDCTTLSVMRVPFYADELVKTLIESPAYIHTLAKEVRAQITQSSLPAILARLRQERVIAGDFKQGHKVGQEQVQYCYSEEQIAKVAKLITATLEGETASFVRHAFDALSLAVTPAKDDSKFVAKGDIVATSSQATFLPSLQPMQAVTTALPTQPKAKEHKDKMKHQ